ncbi:ASI1-immunoprecipitated protein 2-like isoform X2 [Cornus florida]|nr:ASI1-immunoprecipitated protein 2-like isoform X2 [Cornus florida]
MRLLIYCVNCRDSAVHHYCLDNFSPSDDNITWMCEECEPKVRKFSMFRKSERTTLKNDQAVDVRMNRKNNLKKECSSVTGNGTVFMKDRLAETPKPTSDCSLPCEEMKDLHSVDETFGNQAVEVRMNRKNNLKKERSSLTGNRTVFMKDRLAETPKPTSDCSLPCEEMKDLHSVDETFGNQVLRKKRRLLLDGDSSEEDFEPVKVEASLLASYDHCGQSNVSYSQPYLESDNHVHFENQELRKQERILLLKDRDSPEEELEDQAVEVRMNRKNNLKKECSSLTGNRTVFMKDRLAETLPCEEMKDLHSVDETFGNQAVEFRMNRKNNLKKECSSLIGNRTVFMKDGQAETPKPTSDRFLPGEEMKDLYSVDETFGNQVLRKRRRLLLDGDSSEEDFEPAKAEASLLASYDHCGPSNVSYSRPYLESDNHAHFENQELRKQERILLLKDRDSPEEELETVTAEASYGHYGPLNVSYSRPSWESDNYVHAQPVIDPIWRGSLNITNEKNKTHVGLVAHLSSKACDKVSNAATLLPQELDVEILPRCDAWPKSFKTLPPTDDNIALYIFPKFERDEKVFDNLLDEIIEHKLALKAVINDVELLVFSSLELPQEHWRFRRKYYLWGVFRPKKYSPAPVPTIHPAMQSRSSQCVALPKHTIQAVRQGAKGLARTMATPSHHSPLSTGGSHVYNNPSHSIFLARSKSSSTDSLSSCASKLSRVHKTEQGYDELWHLKMQHRKGENRERMEALDLKLIVT